MVLRIALVMALFGVSVAGCASEEEADDWAAEEGLVGSEAAPLISTWYVSSGRKIYARASAFRGTPNVKITTRTAVTGTCHTTGPVVMQRLPASSTSATVCSSVGLIYGPVSGGGSACRTSSSTTPIALMYYNYTNGTQTQLNYNVFDWDGRNVLDQSGWQPGGAGNGCPR